MLAARLRLAQALSPTLGRTLESTATQARHAPRMHSAPSAHLRHLAAAPLGPDGEVVGLRRQCGHARKHFERRIVPFSQRELYDVVANVDEYSEFVPWCTASRVTTRIDDRHVIADLSVGFRVLSDKYSSVITLDPYRSVSADVPHSGLFEYLITDWKFDPAVDPSATSLMFYVEFAFRNPLYQRVTDLFFEEVVKQMVGAFEKRCHAKYRVPERRGGILHRW